MDKEVRLIDANALKHKIIGDPNIYPGKTFQHAILQIDNAPTIDAELVRHGKYREISAHRDDNGYILRDYECTNCLGIHRDVPEDNEHDLPRYCCMCGAKMDGGKKS